MFKNKTNPNPSALEGELENMEGGEIGRLLHSVGQQVTPRAEFVQQLEDRISVDVDARARAAPHTVPEPIQAYKPQIERSRPLLEWSRVRLSLVGVGLSMAMVMLLGLSMFYSNSEEGLSARPDSTATIPQPTFPQGIGESIVLSSWVSNWDTKESEWKSWWEVFPIDPATGKAVPGYEPFVVGKSKEYMGHIQLSPKGTRLVVTEARNSVRWPWAGGMGGQGSADVLHLIDVQAWREVTATLSSNQAVGQLVFTDDGRHLAVNLSRYSTEPAGLADELVLLDAATGAIISRRDLEIHPSRIEFNADGSRLVVFGQNLGARPAMDKPGPLRVMLLDGATLKTIWEHTLDGIVGGYWCEANCEAPHEQKVFASWYPAVAFSPDRDKLYIVHADADKLTTIDFVAQKVGSVDIAEAKSWLESLLDLTASKAEAKARTNGVEKSAVLSADGTQLYVTGQEMDAKRDPEARVLGRQVIDIKSGRKVAGIESDLFGLRVYHVGKHIFLSGLRDGAQVTDVLDAVTLERVTTIENWRVTPVRLLNGQAIILASRRVDNQTEFGLMDPQTFQVSHTWLAPRDMGMVYRGDR